jgi:hypothetical protein
MCPCGAYHSKVKYMKHIEKEKGETKLKKGLSAIIVSG